MAGERRFPKPWTVEERGESFVVLDARGQPLTYSYFEEELQRQRTMNRLSKDDAYRIARAVTRLPGLLRRD